jgi:hypothetical protein
VWYNLAHTNDTVLAGARIPLGEQACLDSIGVRDSQALFKVNCGAAS